MKKFVSILFFLCIILFGVRATWIPEKPSPPRLMNDLAGMLSGNEAQQMENKLVDFSNKTTTQMVIVTLKSLHGEDKAMVATEIGHQWGVGQKGFDNGIVFLIKEKTSDSKGEVFIATGYGLEGVIPDAITKRIIENEVLPSFRQGKYSEGIDKAVSVMMQLSLGEFTAKEYQKRTSGNNKTGGFIAIAILFFVFANIIAGARKSRSKTIGKNIPFWVLLTMLGSGSGHKGSWGSFSSGKGSFGGGGGGGFGGFGGGGFGGGGAGGSW